MRGIALLAALCGPRPRLRYGAASPRSTGTTISRDHPSRELRL